jgi:hypothetical protein
VINGLYNAANVIGNKLPEFINIYINKFPFPCSCFPLLALKLPWCLPIRKFCGIASHRKPLHFQRGQQGPEERKKTKKKSYSSIKVDTGMNCNRPPWLANPQNLRIGKPTAASAP